MDLSQYSMPEIAAGMVITGLVVVFIALVGLWMIVALFGKLLSSANKPKQASPEPTPRRSAQSAPAAPAAPAVKPAMQVEDGIGEEIVAVIAAAVAAMSGGGPVAIRSVRRVREARSSWAQAGVAQNIQQF